ncbi:MAG: exodeoxyribonuclease V subunit gamma [Proteobacteria bacterium]|nr:exodeoxyribonuclease V subunit gamma [Pseudomonadota bacterium]MBU1641107.1 exodeoxyribonuclease V subunit gamma [Pseudomonadota bacterium]
MSFTIYTSNRMELLVEYLAQVLRAQPLPPLVAETVVVQSQGMARWLAMELATRYGVWANGSFPFPNAFLRQIFAQVLGEELVLEKWQRPVLVWRIMELLPDLCRNEAFSQVAVYISTPLKTYQLAVAMADLFDQYVIYRPDFIRDWEAGGDGGWQAMLWRRLRADIDQPHRADLFERSLGLLNSDDCCLGFLPPRVSLFGISSMPPSHLEILHALGRHAEVNIFFLNPCDKEWGDIIPEATISRLERTTGLDRDAQFLASDNPLLASMGRLGRDFFHLLLEHGTDEETLFLEPQDDTLLAVIQGDILKLRDATPGHRSDDSLCFISCHSPMREVESLHDHLLGLFAEHPGLEPRDILVMAPDISSYAPLVEAVFAGNDQPLLPYTVADQSHGEEECIAGFFQMLDLAPSRFKALDLVALLEISALRRCFQLSLDDVSLITSWLAELRICWGRDGADRSRFGLPPYEDNSWQAGLDRLLLGFAMADDQLFAGILPYDGAHLEPELASRFLTFYHTLAQWADRLSLQYDLPTWSGLLLQLSADLFSPDQDEERQMQVLRTALAALSQEASLAAFGQSLGLDVVADRVRKAVSQDLSPYGFMGGGITFCSLLPMRAVPFKIICLLGMNDGDFPRSPARFGFDLMVKEFRRGDRSMRFDDRYLFLEALLSARDQLYISYLGRSVVDDSERAPSVLVRELLEYVARMCISAGATEKEEQLILRSLVLQQHLQPFHSEYFQGKLASFSEKNLSAARELIRHSQGRIDFGRGLPLPEAEAERRHLDLVALQRFWQSPARFFCEQRLGLRLEGEEELLAEDEPFGLGGLERYELSRDLVQGLLAAEPLTFDQVRARGVLPHGAMAEVVFAGVEAKARSFAQQVEELGGGVFASQSGSLTLGSYQLEVELANVNTLGQFHYRFGKMDGRHILRTWISHLALNSLDLPSAIGRQSLLIADDGVVRLAPLDNAQTILQTLLELYWQGLRQPLPFFAKASYVFVEACQKGKREEKAIAAATKTLWGDDYSTGEWQWDPSLKRCFSEESQLGEEFSRLARTMYEPVYLVMDKE